MARELFMEINFVIDEVLTDYFRELGIEPKTIGMATLTLIFPSAGFTKLAGREVAPLQDYSNPWF